MARKPDLDATLERLVEIRDDPSAPGALDALREILASPLSHAVARAAEIVGSGQLRDFEPDLVEAYDRFGNDPVRRDPGCRAKTALVDALQFLDASEPDLYLRAVRTTQLEPVYGGRQDTAAELRGAAGRGLVRMNHPDAMLVLAELLADPESNTRIAAVRALAAWGHAAGLPLLRLKALAGDEDPTVVGDSLLAMLEISSEDSLDFVERFLDGPLAELALFALGESRAAGALPLLRSYWERSSDRALQCNALLAAAMMRSDEAIDWLLALVAREPGPVARDAIQAFEIHRGDARLVGRVQQTARDRTDVDLEEALRSALG